MTHRGNSDWADHLPIVSEAEAVRVTQGEARLARFDATQDVLLASVALDRTRGPLTPAEHDAKAEELAAACRRYLAAHEAVKAGGR